MFNFLDMLLSKLPFNGDKTLLGTVLTAVSTSPELVAIPQLSVPLHVLGIAGIMVGLIHKGIKLVKN